MIVEVDQQNDVCVVRFKGRLVSDQDREYLVAKWDEIKKLNRGKVLADFRESSFDCLNGHRLCGGYLHFGQQLRRSFRAGRRPSFGAESSRLDAIEYHYSNRSRSCIGSEPASRLAGKKLPHAPQYRIYPLSGRVSHS